MTVSRRASSADVGNASLDKTRVCSVARISWTRSRLRRWAPWPWTRSVSRVAHEGWRGQGGRGLVGGGGPAARCWRTGVGFGFFVYDCMVLGEDNCAIYVGLAAEGALRRRLHRCCVGGIGVASVEGSSSGSCTSIARWVALHRQRQQQVWLGTVCVGEPLQDWASRGPRPLH